MINKVWLNYKYELTPYPGVFEYIPAVQSMEGTDNLLTDPEMMKLTQNPDTKFDVVMTSFIPTSEVAYFLAHRFSAQLVLYCSAQGLNSIGY